MKQKQSLRRSMAPLAILFATPVMGNLLPSNWLQGTKLVDPKVTKMTPRIKDLQERFQQFGYTIATGSEVDERIQNIEGAVFGANYQAPRSLKERVAALDLKALELFTFKGELEQCNAVARIRSLEEILLCFGREFPDVADTVKGCMQRIDQLEVWCTETNSIEPASASSFDQRLTAMENGLHDFAYFVPEVSTVPTPPAKTGRQSVFARRWSCVADHDDTKVLVYITTVGDGQISDSKSALVHFVGAVKSSKTSFFEDKESQAIIPYAELALWKIKHDVEIPVMFNRLELVKNEDEKYELQQVELDLQACDELRNLDKEACRELGHSPSKPDLNLGEHPWHKLQGEERQVYRKRADKIIEEGQQRASAKDFALEVDAEKAEELKSTDTSLGENARRIQMPKGMRKRDRSITRAIANLFKSKAKSDLEKDNRKLEKREKKFRKGQERRRNKLFLDRRKSSSWMGPKSEPVQWMPQPATVSSGNRKPLTTYESLRKNQSPPPPPTQKMPIIPEDKEVSVPKPKRKWFSCFPKLAKVAPTVTPPDDGNLQSIQEKAVHEHAEVPDLMKEEEEKFSARIQATTSKRSLWTRFMPTSNKVAATLDDQPTKQPIQESQ